MTTAFILGSGPSMRPADANQVRDLGVVYTLGLTAAMAPWADYAVSVDPAFWVAYAEKLDSFPKSKLCGAVSRHGLNAVAQKTMLRAIELGVQPVCGWTTNMDSACLAMLHAVATGVDQIILLGVDYSTGHWHKPHVAPLSNFSAPSRAIFQQAHESMAALCIRKGVLVLNASRDTALTCYHRAPLAQALAVVVPPTPATRGITQP